jgi:3-oxoacyl-[acyl-carrier-protein] synthase II
MKRRVVITGVGICTGVGCGVEAFWEGLKTGKSGISPITVFDASALSVRIGGQVKELNPERLMTLYPEAEGERDRKIWLGLDAASQAILDAGLHAGALLEALLIVGVSLETFFLNDVSPLADARNTALALRDITQGADGPRLQTPLDRLMRILGGHWGFRQGRYTNCSACAAGAQAIGDAFQRIRDGSTEVALAGASDSVINPLAMGGFSLLQILSTENETPEKACRPFDATRRGTVLGEGAAFLVLEALERAVDRGARPYAEILGYGSSFDAYRLTDPEPTGQGAVLSMTKAMADAGLNAEEIDGINAHGTGTPKNDVAETRAIKRALGKRAFEIPVTANKSMTGHLIAASGAVEAVASALTLFAGIVPPTINFFNRDLECDLDYVAEGRRSFEGRTMLSNSFGFGGQNAALVFRRARTSPEHRHLHRRILERKTMPARASAVTI